MFGMIEQFSTDLWPFDFGKFQLFRVSVHFLRRVALTEMKFPFIFVQYSFKYYNQFFLKEEWRSLNVSLQIQVDHFTVWTLSKTTLQFALE